MRKTVNIRRCDHCPDADSPTNSTCPFCGRPANQAGGHGLPPRQRDSLCDAFDAALSEGAVS